MAMTRDGAIDYCTKRWHFQVSNYPSMAGVLPLDYYVRANLAATMRLRPDSELTPDELRNRKLALGER